MPNLNSPSARGPDRRRTIRRRDTTESLDRLLDGAQATFAERGYHAANIHEICARASVGIGTFYAHFDHKRELLQKVMVERATLLSGLLSPEDLLDRERLVARLRTVLDDPVDAGLWRAWHEAILEEADIARFHAQWRVARLKVLTTVVADARKRTSRKGRRIPAPVVAWSITTLALELTIHDRRGAPDLVKLAQLIRELVLGTIGPD